MKNKISKQIPKFKNEIQERKFWATHDLTDYLNQFEEVKLDLSKLKPTTEAISIRLPSYMLQRIKEIANSRDVPYQSLMKIFLAKQMQQELKISNS